MQLALWEQGPVHHFMELHYRSGERRVIDTANPDDDDTDQDRDIWMAGFVSAEAALHIPSKETTRANAMREAKRLAERGN